jgi:hypothetical protein
VTVQAPTTETQSQTGNTTHNKSVVTTTRTTTSGDPIYDLTLDFKGATQAFSTKQRVDVVFVVDVSGSMEDSIAQGSATTRIQAARDAIGSLQAAAAKQELVASYALVTFAGTDYHDKKYNDAKILVRLERCFYRVHSGTVLQLLQTTARVLAAAPTMRQA